MNDELIGGLVGDRAYGLVDRESGKLASAKHPRKFGRLFEFRAAFIEPPTLDAPIPSVRITFPNGAVVTSKEPSLDQRLSDALGRDATFAASALTGATLEEVHNRMKAGGLGELPCAGVYAAVLTPGTIRRGDVVGLE
jgi:hypothetical protein